MTSMTSWTEYSTQTQKTSTLFSGQYLRNHWTLDIGVLGYIGIVWPKEHSPKVRSFPPRTPCILACDHRYCSCYTQDNVIRMHSTANFLPPTKQAMMYFLCILCTPNLTCIHHYLTTLSTYIWMTPSCCACVTKFYCKVSSIHNYWIAVIVLQLVNRATCFGCFIRPTE